MEKNLADLRREYSREELSEASVAADPFVQFSNWFDEYLSSAPQEPSAFVLSTARRDGLPSSRTVLLKGFDANGFVFYTNYGSKKARDINENPQVAMLFFWPELERQIHISGSVEKTTREESEAYFGTRPMASKLGAWASNQSEKLTDRKELEDRLEDLKSRFADGEIPCPPFWGGFRIVPARFEFWQGRPSRLHDRIVYELDGTGWMISRLNP